MSYKHLYGRFSERQMLQVRKDLRASIFFLLLCVDKKTRHEYKDVDVNQCFEGLLLKMGGLNKLLNEPLSVVTTMSLLQAAQNEFNSPKFSFWTYRKLILDAGSEIMKL